MAGDTQSRRAEIIAGELQASIRRSGISPVRRGVEFSDNGLEDLIDAPGEFDIEVDLGMLHSGADVSRAPFTSHRRIMGPFIIAVKNFARELLVQLLDRQSLYNQAAAQVISHLRRKVDALSADQARMARRVAALEARLSVLQSGLRRMPGANRLDEAGGPRPEAVGFDDTRPAPRNAPTGGKGGGPWRA